MIAKVQKDIPIHSQSQNDKKWKSRREWGCIQVYLYKEIWGVHVTIGEVLV